MGSEMCIRDRFYGVLMTLTQHSLGFEANQCYGKPPPGGRNQCFTWSLLAASLAGWWAGMRLGGWLGRWLDALWSGWLEDWRLDKDTLGLRGGLVDWWLGGG